MTEDPLLVEEIDVVRAPGFDAGGLPVTDLSSGINVVHGPNASGKTTMARAIQWLLWPGELPNRASVTGRLSRDGESWRVQADPDRVRYRRDGAEVSGPNLPPADRRDRYRLALHDLLQADTRDESFARRIERESAGGYDLAAAHEALGFDDSPSTRRLSVVDEAERAVAAVREATDEGRDLRRERDRLATLRSDLEAAERAAERADLLETAIEYAEATADLAAAEETLAEFPDVCADLDGDEAETVADLDERIAEQRERKADAEAEIEDAREDLAAADLPAGGLPTGTLDRVREYRDALADLEDDRERIEADLADAEAQRANALSDVPLAVEEADLGDLDPDVWDRVSALAREAEQVRADRKVQDAVERWLDGDDRPPVDLPTIERASRALENWLASPPPDGDDGSEAFRVAAAAAVPLAVAGGLLAALVHPALAVFVLLAVGIAWYGYRIREESDGPDSRATHRETFADLGLAGPDSWTEAAVRERLTDLYDDIAAHRVAKRRADLRDALSTEVDHLDDRETSLAEHRSELREHLGVAPETTDVQLLAVVKGILRWQAQDDRVVGLRERLAAVESQIESTRADLRGALAPYGYDEVADAAQATAHLRDLEDRAARHEEAERAIERAEETVAEATETVERLETERDAVYDRAGLSSGEHDRLCDLCERVPAYREAVTDRENAAHLVDDRERALEAAPGYDPDLKERSVEDLRRERAECEEAAAEREGLREDITEIETKIAEAKQSNDVEEALAERDRALDAVADQLTADYGALVGDVLTEHVRSRSTERSRPAVFERAGEILARITRGRYRLDLDEAGEQFRAYDAVRERAYGLDDLSSATRVQVLLSVRLAFVEEQERGVRLPLVLDETLANTDDGKAGVIVDALLELARAGRQVFYFTAQGDEVARWLAALEDADVDHAVVDLADVRDLDGRVEVPDLDAVADRGPAPPAPDGRDHEAYGDALDVPDFDPRGGAGRAHLWYVVEDVDLLYRLLDLGVERWGQLETLLDRTDASVVGDDPAAIAAAERAGAALAAFVDAWQTGRGERVDREVLRESGAVSDTFMDEVADLAASCDGDAERIVDSLRNGAVDRFRSDKTDELERYFRDHGYVDPVAPLDPAAVRARVVQSFVDDGLPRERASERAERLLSRLA